MITYPLRDLSQTMLEIGALDLYFIVPSLGAGNPLDWVSLLYYFDDISNSWNDLKWK